MFKDRDEALKRMEKALLEEETQALPEIDEDEEEEWDEVDIYDYEAEEAPYVGKFEAFNTDDCDEDLDSYSDEVAGSQGEGSLMGLALTALGLLAGILAVAAYWVFRFWGA